MDARFYNSEDIDIERLATDLVNVYLAQGYQAQQIGNRDQLLVQLKKGGDFEAIIGMQAALSLTLQRTAGGVLAMIGQQRWIDKAAVGAVGIVALPVLWPLAITAGVGALRQASLGNQVLNVVDGLIRQQRPGIQIGPVPAQIAPQIQRQWAPRSLPPPAYVPPTPAYVPSQPENMPPQVVYSQPVPQPVLPSVPASNQLRCTQCNTPYEAGDTFCSGCGRPLTAPRLYCSNCNTEVKSGASFCPKCGASTFQAMSATQQHTARSAPQPAPYTPPVQSAPVYTPPAPATPVYTPPARPTPPPEPQYTPPTPATPPSQPQPTVYYVPSSQPQTTDPAAPTQPTPKKPAEPYYVPPARQEPVAAPQPKVTIVPSTPKQEPPPPQKPRPQKQYYIPSNQAQEISQTQPTIPAQPVAQPSSASSAPWGTLTFSDGQQIQLVGENAAVGRYDHDVGGMQPEVDLGKMTGADTVSRIHATFEHSGNTYTLTDLNSTNATRINGKRLEPDKATPIQDGDALQFGKVTCTFHSK